MNLHASVVDALTAWHPPDGASESLREAVLGFVLARDDACRRACVPGHVTASALVVDHTLTRVLLTLHPRIGRWVQLGGHCEDTDPDIAAAAGREAAEESGIDGLTVEPGLVSVHVHALTCSLGVPTRHYDLQYLAIAPAGAQIALSDESVDLRWWPADGLPDSADSSVAQLVSRAQARLGRQTSVE